MQIFWGTLDVTSVITLVFGALLSAALSYAITSKREKKLLRLKLEADTLDTLQSMIKDCCDKFVMVAITSPDILTMYNKTKKEQSSALPEVIEFINKNLNDLITGYQLFYDATLKIVFYVKTKEIIFYRNMNTISKLCKTSNKYFEKGSDIVILKASIEACIKKTAILSDDIIDQYEALFKCLESLANEIKDLLLELSFKLNRELYKKLYIIRWRSLYLKNGDQPCQTEKRRKKARS